jgi:hypothetical protein
MNETHTQVALPSDPTRPECIITGCSLFSPPSLGEHHLNGDLFQLGNCYIFNANPQLAGPQDFAYSKTVTVSRHFSRRHVYVFLKAAAELNDAAKEYIA